MSASSSPWWFTRRRLIVALTIVAIPEALYLLAAFLGQHHVGADFAVFYAASTFRHTGHPELLSSPEVLTQTTERMLGRSVLGTYVWAYPPMLHLIVYPLAWLPLGWAYAAATALGVAAYASAMTRIAGARREVLAAALVFTGVPLSIIYGNTSLLTTALLGWGLALRPARPLLAGVLLGALSFKPHLLVLAPVALAAGRRWRALLAAGATAAALAAVATALFGWEAWVESARGAAFIGDMVATQSALLSGLQSVFSAVRVAGAPLRLAWAAQLGASAAVAAIVWRTWSRPSVSDDLKAAALGVATLLATPYLWNYDLTLLAVPIAFFVRHAEKHGWRAREQAVLAIAAMVPVVAVPFSKQLHLAPGPLIAAVLLWLVVRRAGEPAPQVAGELPIAGG